MIPGIITLALGLPVAAYWAMVCRRLGRAGKLMTEAGFEHVRLLHELREYYGLQYPTTPLRTGAPARDSAESAQGP